MDMYCIADCHSQFCLLLLLFLGFRGVLAVAHLPCIILIRPALVPVFFRAYRLLLCSFVLSPHYLLSISASLHLHLHLTPSSVQFVFKSNFNFSLCWAVSLVCLFLGFILNNGLRAVSLCNICMVYTPVFWHFLLLPRYWEWRDNRKWEWVWDGEWLAAEVPFW